MRENPALVVFGILLGIFIYLITILPKERCTTPIWAVCTGYVLSVTRGVTRYSPLFEYEYKGRRYRQKSLTLLKKNELQYYQKGYMHLIWISERFPGICISSKRYTGLDFYVLILGTFFILTSILMMLVLLGVV